VVFSNKVYSFVKFLAQIFFPGVATLYAALAQIWNWPYVTQVVASIAAFDTFLGGLLYLSAAGYKPPVDGVVHIDQTDPTRNVMTMDFADPTGVVQGQYRTLNMEVRGPKTASPTIQQTVER
jgi:hypothetical protein